MKVYRFVIALISLIHVSFSFDDDPRIIFHSPHTDQHVSGRTFVIDVEISGLLVPQNGKGILYLDEGKLLEVRQQHVTVTMDGAGGLGEGTHTLKLLLLGNDGALVHSETVTFLKVGSPEELAGPFHDTRYDDDALREMHEACGQLPSRDTGDVVRDEDWPAGHRKIALGLPVVSSKARYDGEENDDMRVQQTREEFIDSMHDLPMVKIFIPSLLEKAKHEKGNYSYVLYLGYDKGDPFFDVEEKRHALTQLLGAMTRDAPVELLWFQYEGMEGKVFWIYNDLFRQAYEDGADYFYMVNDDLLLLTERWADRFIMALEGSRLLSRFGVAGPLDVRDRHKHHMCFAFHSRLHYEIFGTFYPEAFQNWWSDYWATLVYGPNATFWFRDVHVRNTEAEGRRYPAFWEGSDYFPDEVAAGRRRLTQFCRCISANGRWRFNACMAKPNPSSSSAARQPRSSDRWTAPHAHARHSRNPPASPRVEF